MLQWICIRTVLSLKMPNFLTFTFKRDGTSNVNKFSYIAR